MFISWQQFHAPLRPGLDFVGGTRLQFELDCTQPKACDHPIDLTLVRTILSDAGLGDSSVQVLGNEQHAVSIRTKPLDVERRTQLQTALGQKLGTFISSKTQIDMVGPTLGKQLFASGLMALFASFFGIAFYLSIRFQADYAIIAIFALFHDALITLGIFSIFGLLFGIEVDSLVYCGITHHRRLLSSRYGGHLRSSSRKLVANA